MIRILLLFLKTVSLFVFLLSLVTPAAAQQQILFQDGFENGITNWTVVSAGVPNTVTTSAAQAYRGSNSAFFNLIDPDPGKYLHLQRVMSSTTNILVRVFFYDTLDQTLGALIGLKKPNSTETTGVGINTGISTVNYIVRNNNAAGMFDSGIPRKTGWNMFEIIITSQGSFVKINNSLVYQGTTPFINTTQTATDAIQIVSTWGLLGQTYWDDLTVVARDERNWQQIELQTVADYYDIYEDTNFSPLYSVLGLAPHHSNDLRSIMDTASAFYVHGLATNNQQAKDRGLQLLKDGIANGKWDQVNDWARGIAVSPMVYASKLMWTSLDEQTKTQAFRIVSAQTENYITRNRMPETGYIGDTKAEENAWHADFLAAAANFFPGIPNRDAVEAKARCFAYHSITRASDPVYCGITTQTVYDDFRLENHNLTNPSYTISPIHLLSRGARTYVLTGKPVPSEFQHNIAPLYQKLLTFLDPISYFFINVPPLDWTGINNTGYYGNPWQYPSSLGLPTTISPDDYFRKRSLFFYKIPNDYIKDPPVSIPFFDQTARASESYTWFLATNNSANVQAGNAFLYGLVTPSITDCTNVRTQTPGQPSNIIAWKQKFWGGIGFSSCDTSAFHEAPSSLRLMALDPANTEVYSPLIAIQPNTLYTVSYWVKTDSLQPATTDSIVNGRVFVAQYNSAARETEEINASNRLDSGLTLGESITGTNGWMPKSYTFTTLPTAAFVRLRAGIGGGGSGGSTGSTWFDSVSLIQGIPTPTSTITPSPTNTPSPIPGDLDNDRKVNVTDLISALAQSPLSIFTYNLVVGDYGRQ